jgi:hypothetical protein
VTTPEAIAANLTPAERVLLFCLASDTPYARVAITSATVKHMIVRGLVERGPTGRLALTDQGLAALAALLPQLRAP